MKAAVTARVHRIARAGLAAVCLGSLAASALATGCKKDPPSAAVTSAPADSQAEAGSDPDAAAEAGGEAGASSLTAGAADRSLWFSSGVGRDAILARERRDHGTAVAKLDELLAGKDLSESDRGAAQLLRGLEDIRLERYASAADRFAEARGSAELSALDVWLRVHEAQARLDAGQPEPALVLVEDIDGKALAGTPHTGDVIILRGDARLRTDDHAGARKAYAEYLRRYPDGARRHGTRAKLAQTLVAIGGSAELKAAVTAYETLQLQTPLSDYGKEASRELPALRKKAGIKRSSTQVRDYERKVELAVAESNLSKRNYGNVIKTADRLLRKDKSNATQCRALYFKGSAIFKQRKRAAARPVFDKAAAACAKAGSGYLGTRVKSRYQAGRGLYAEGKYAKAAGAFESLAKEHRSHSYADDAWILAGESWEEHGDAPKARKAYRAALGVRGDMQNEARRRVLVMAMSAKDFEGALEVLDDGLAGKLFDPKDRAKLHYFRGRALAALGRGDEAEAAWLETIRTLPLDYASLQALSRLRERSDAALGRGVTLLQKEDPDSAGLGELPQSPAAARALLLARLGLGEDAREELDVAGVEGWPAVAVLNDAGLYSAGQRMIANMGSTWRSSEVAGPVRERWEAAYPRPFQELVTPGEEQHAVPGLLTWAIMQTESRFNPGVTSWAGARGLVQLMPATAKGLAKEAGVALSNLDALFDPALNLDLGQRYLGKLSARFGGGHGGAALAIPSYNGGAGNVDKWLAERGAWPLDLFVESIPFDETRRYTQSVLGRWMAYRWLYGEGGPVDRIPFLPEDTPRRAR